MSHHELSIPEDLLYLVTANYVGHVSFIRRDGSIATHLMWIDWDGKHLLTSSPIGSVKGRNLRRDPHTSVSSVDREDDWRFVILHGNVIDIRPDTDLAFIDKMSLRYTGQPYMRRTGEREIFVIKPEHIRFGRGGWARRHSV